MEDINKLYWLRKEKKDLSKRIEKLDSQIAELNNLGSAPMDSMPKGTTTSDPTGKYVTKLIELKEKRKAMLLDITYLELQAEDYIKNVNNSEIRTIMRAYYIDGLSWNDIAKEYYKKNRDGSTPRKKVSNYIKNIKK